MKQYSIKRKNALRIFRLFVVKILKCLFFSLLIFGGCTEKEEPLYIKLDLDTLTFKSEGGNQTITILSNGEWAVSGETDWCTVSPKTGKGDLTVTVTVSENETTNERKVTLTFTCGMEIVKVEVSLYGREEWILINGVRWATRNVGEPGTFVQNPEDYGSHYQWNKGTTDFLFYKDYYNSSYSKSISWLSTNDPCPAGYRVPTSAEIQSLTNGTYVKYEWITRNGVYGEKFIDVASGKSIFLPAAGFRFYYNGTLCDVGLYGLYWSSTQSSGNGPYVLFFDSGGAYWGSWDDESYGLSVRPVAE